MARTNSGIEEFETLRTATELKLNTDGSTQLGAKWGIQHKGLIKLVQKCRINIRWLINIVVGWLWEIAFFRNQSSQFSNNLNEHRNKHRRLAFSFINLGDVIVEWLRYSTSTRRFCPIMSSQVFKDPFHRNGIHKLPSSWEEVISNDRNCTVQ